MPRPPPPPDPPPRPRGLSKEWRLVAASFGCLGAAAIAALLAYVFWSAFF